ncbi:hypothetical protein MTO98_31060 [Mucilaginibacter sp. SMC90]|uniref:hypothetical protein n=1 Tax=Mucilaginibacter sp. SMC90 TaxID=2929803 RepID=UPI001FB3C425|nr:hypothetical protein [Mucilaginibacter sp. SMC90]UOE48842.1 hypothetical protein MTO98_31060 [Mucilaginibacter sp. SMC90]
MKNFIKLFLTLVLISQITLNKALAQNTKTNSGIRLSVGPESGIPVGNMHDRYNWNLGGSVQVDVPISGNPIYLTGLAGFNNFFSKNELTNVPDLQIIPVKAGLKYFPLNNFYIQGQAGASFLLDKAKNGYDNSTAFSYAPQVGYQFPVGSSYIDASVKWEGNTKFKTGGTSNNFIGLRLAYGFGV